MRKRNFILTLAAALLVCGVTATIGYRHWSSANSTERSSSEPTDAIPKVTVNPVTVRDLAPTAEFIGTVVAQKVVELRPRVGGVVEAVNVPEGKFIHRGDLLFQIDPKPFEVALEAAIAQQKQAQSLLDQAEADYDRAQRLAPSGAIARKTLDDAAAIRRQRRALVDVAAAAVAEARLNLSYSSVKAPISGRIDRILVNEGNLVAGANASNPTLLTSIVSVDPVFVYFDMDEPTYLEFSRSGQPHDAEVRLGLIADVGFPLSGKLDFISTRLDAGTGTIKARAMVQNPDGKLIPGLFTRVRLTTGASRPTVTIDDKAVRTDQDRRYVMVLGSQNTAEYRQVLPGPLVDGLREIKDGLKSGETVIISGAVRPGTRVLPVLASTNRGAASTRNARVVSP